MNNDVNQNTQPNRKTRILLADDSMDARTLLRHRLHKWGYEIIEAVDGDEAWEILQKEDAPRLAILDWIMPGMQGPEICREVRKQAQEPAIYILMLTSRTDKDSLVEGFEAGADDFLAKPFETDELHSRLRAGQRIVQLQREMIDARDILREMATHDPLTGLWNRRAIIENLRHELARAHRQKAPLSVVLADLDHFKKVNDTHGHLAGDAVLRETADKMKSSMRSYDAVGRYGGEEFLMVLPGCSAKNAREQIERIRTSIMQHRVKGFGAPIQVTLSAGIASIQEDDFDVDGLLNRADNALYEAKAAGRNQVIVATQSVEDSFENERGSGSTIELTKIKQLFDSIKKSLSNKQISESADSTAYRRIASHCGVSPQTVRSWIAGDSQPSPMDAILLNILSEQIVVERGQTPPDA